MGKATFAAGAEIISSGMPKRPTKPKSENGVMARQSVMAIAFVIERETIRTMRKKPASKLPRPRMTLPSTRVESSPCKR
jgi:hypothetical protein